MQLTVIGCSGSFPGPDSPASCYLLTAEHEGRTWRVLLDLGSGALTSLQQRIGLADIDAICLTHLHPDHYMDLCGLHVAVKWCPSGWPGRRIPIYGPAGTDERIAVAYGMDPEPGMTGEFEFRSWTEDAPEQIGPFTITPYAVRHPAEEAYALRVEAVGAQGDVRTLTYSGDTDTCEGLVRAAASADVFLCEAAYQDGREEQRGIHLNGSRAGQMAAEAAAEHLLLTHIPVWTDPQVLVEHAGRTFGGPLTVAQHGATYTI